MVEQGRDKELDVDFFYSDKVKHSIKMTIDRIDFKLTIDGS